MRKTIEVPVRYVVQYTEHNYWTDHSVHMQYRDAVTVAEKLFKDYAVRVVSEEVRLVETVLWGPYR